MSQSFNILKTTAIRKHGNGLKIRIGYTDQWSRTEILRSKQPIVAIVNRSGKGLQLAILFLLNINVSLIINVRAIYKMIASRK